MTVFNKHELMKLEIEVKSYAPTFDCDNDSDYGDYETDQIFVEFGKFVQDNNDSDYDNYITYDDENVANASQKDLALIESIKKYDSDKKEK